MLNLEVADHVRYQSQEHGGVVILDTADGKWLALNASAGDFWRAWNAGCGFEEGLRAVATRYPQVPAVALRADAEELRRSLVDRGLLRPVTASLTAAEAAPPYRPGCDASGAVMAEPTAPRQRLRPIRAGLTLCALVVSCLIVRCTSFRVQLALVRLTRRWCRRPAAEAEAAAIVSTVDWAVRHYPGRAACLEQSLTAVLLAAGRGRRLDWCLGSVPDPYRFHAWVEAEGRPVPTRDDPPSWRGYARLLSA